MDFTIRSSLEESLLNSSTDSSDLASPNPHFTGTHSPHCTMTSIAHRRDECFARGHKKHGLNPCPGLEAAKIFDIRAQVFMFEQYQRINYIYSLVTPSSFAVHALTTSNRAWFTILRTCCRL